MSWIELVLMSEIPLPCAKRRFPFLTIKVPFAFSFTAGKPIIWTAFTDCELCCARMSELVTTAKNSGTVRKRLLLFIIMFNSESNVRLNEWFHRNKYPHQKLQVGCQLLRWQVIEIKGHIRGSSEPHLPDDGLCPHPGRKTRLLTITNGPSR